jgi:hypothetical protein
VDLACVAAARLAPSKGSARGVESSTAASAKAGFDELAPDALLTLRAGRSGAGGLDFARFVLVVACLSRLRLAALLLHSCEADPSFLLRVSITPFEMGGSYRYHPLRLAPLACVNDSTAVMRYKQRINWVAKQDVSTIWLVGVLFLGS